MKDAEIRDILKSQYVGSVLTEEKSADYVGTVGTRVNDLEDD